VRTRSRCCDPATLVLRACGIAALNMQCLVYRPSDVAWDAITSHLSSFSVTQQRRYPSVCRPLA
ncbi:hypothetical protein BC826DRAFT_1072191, partial [Russula brevipes]